jgi:alpha-tubulin suppressor-like RCC1 family protein
VRCWGNNDNRQLGDDTRGHRTRPGKIAALTPASRLALGGRNTCVHRPDGVLRCWGSQHPPSAITSQDGFAGVSRASVADGARCWVMTDARLQCSGANHRGEVGTGGTEPVLEPTTIAGLSDVVDVSMGAQHACAVQRDGTVWCWGAGDSAALGDGSGERRTRPALVAGIDSAVAVYAGLARTCARLSDGAIRCWGWFATRELARGDLVFTTPTVIPELAGARQIVFGNAHSCARMADGAVQCWGIDQHGQLGTGRSMVGALECRAQVWRSTDLDIPPYPCRDRPTTVPGLRDVVDLAAGSEHTCALRRDGEVRCWGCNRYGQLGDGTNETRVSPTPVVW